MTGLHSCYRKTINFGGDEYDISVLSIENAISVKSITLPMRGEPDRALIEIKFEVFTFINTHLSLTAEFSVVTADIINNEMARFHKQIILTGDFNISSSKEFFNYFGNKRTVISPDEASWSADQPRDQFDYNLIADPTNQIPINGPRPERVRSEERINSNLLRLITARFTSITIWRRSNRQFNRVYSRIIHGRMINLTLSCFQKKNFS